MIWICIHTRLAEKDLSAKVLPWRYEYSIWILAVTFDQSFNPGGGSRSDGSTSARECFQHGLRPDWEMTHTRTRGGKDCVCNRGRDRRHRRLAEAYRCFCARKKFNFNFRYVSHAKHPIAIEIRIFWLPFDKLRTLIQGQSQAPQSGTLHLGFGTVGMNDRSTVDDKGQLLHSDVTVRPVDPHARRTGDPCRHPAFLPEGRRDSEADVLRHRATPCCLLRTAGEHCGLPVCAAYRIRRRAGVTACTIE